MKWTTETLEEEEEEEEKKIEFCYGYGWIASYFYWLRFLCLWR